MSDGLPASRDRLIAVMPGVAWLLLVLFVPHPAFAIDASLADGGAFRAGQWMTVTLRDLGDADRVELHGDGLMPTIVTVDGAAGPVEAPVLPLRSVAGPLRVTVDGVERSVELPLFEIADKDDDASANDWAMPRSPLGPGSAIVGEDAYLPVAGWRPAQPRPLRRFVLLVAILFALLFVAASVLPRRSAIATAVVLAGAGVLVFATMQPKASAPAIAVGRIEVRDGETVVRDDWRFIVARTATDVRVPLESGTLPMLVDERQAAALDLEVHINAASGDTALSIRFPRSASSIALLQRVIDDAALPRLREHVRSLDSLARRVYLEDGWNIVGNQAGSTTTVLSRTR